MRLNKIVFSGELSALMLGFALLFGSPSAVVAETKPAVSELPMGPIILDRAPDFPWFSERFGLTWTELETSYNVDEVDAFLLRWRTTYPDDPEAWISSANWNWRLSEETVMFQSGGAENGGFFIVEESLADDTVGFRRIDGDQGDSSGFMSEGSMTNENRHAQASVFFLEALEKFPQRFDLYELMVDFHLEHSNYEALIDFLEVTPQIIRSYSGEFEQANYQPVQLESEVVIGAVFHRAIWNLLHRGETDSNDAVLAASLLMTRALPNDPIAWSHLVSSQSINGNKDGAYRAAQIAYDLAPEDEVIVLNLAILSLDVGLREDAIEYNSWLLQNSNNPSILERARADLELMGALDD